MSKVRTNKFEKISRDSNIQISRKSQILITPHPLDNTIEDIIPSQDSIRRAVKSTNKRNGHRQRCKKTRKFVKMYSILLFIKDSEAVCKSSEMKIRCRSRVAATSFIIPHRYNQICMYFLLPLNTWFLRTRKYQWASLTVFLQAHIHIVFHFLPTRLLLQSAKWAKVLFNCRKLWKNKNKK